jgi:hypothetical protein
MAQPVQYERQQDFADLPDFNAEGTEINRELDNLATTTDEVRVNIALIQKDDGTIANDTIGEDQMQYAVFGVIQNDRTLAETARVGAELAKSLAETAKTSAEATLADFTSKYLGTFSSSPSSSTDGALFFNTTDDVLMVYDANTSTWKRTTPTTAQQAHIDSVGAGIADIQAVSGDLSNISLTATNIADVRNVGGSIADVSSVASNMSKIDTVATKIADVTTVSNTYNLAKIVAVATDLVNVNLVGQNITSVTNVANIDSEVQAVSNIASDVTAVANISTDIQDVQDKLAQIQTTANDLNEATSEIETVANAIVNVDIVGAGITNVNSVGSSIANVNTIATNIANINAVNTNEANINLVANSETNINTVASNLTSINSFGETYSTGATAPTSPTTGDLWFDSSASTMKVYTGSGFVNAGSSVNGVENSVEHSATAGQTSFTATYDAGFLQVFLNGIRLDASDYTATDGANVVLDIGATVDDTLFIHSFGTFILADHYSKVASDARYMDINAVSLPSQTGNADKYLKTDGTDASWETMLAGVSEFDGGDATTVYASTDLILESAGA